MVPPILKMETKMGGLGGSRKKEQETGTGKGKEEPSKISMGKKKTPH
jgi:hypothetical protein